MTAIKANRTFKAEEVALALLDANGLVSVAARRLGCSGPTVRSHIKRSALVRDALNEARQTTLDIAEQSLYRQVEAGEGWAVCFILKTLGKERGYVERQEMTGKDGSPLAVVLQWSEQPRADA